MSDSEDPREKKTDPIGTAPPASDPEIRAATTILPASPLPRSSTGHELLDNAIASVVDAARVVKSYHDELHAEDGPFARQTEKISHIVKSNYDLIHADVRVIKATVEAHDKRLTHAEDRLDSGSSRFAEIDGQIAGLRRQLTRLEKELEGIKNAATPTPPTKTG